MQTLERTPSIFFAERLPLVELHSLSLNPASAEHVIRYAHQGKSYRLICEDACGQTFTLLLRNTIQAKSLTPLLREFLRRQGIDLYKQGSVIYISFGHYSKKRPTSSPFYLSFFGQDESGIVPFVEISREEVSLAVHEEQGEAFAA